MHEVYDILQPILGLNVQPEKLTVSQICLRGTIVFIVTLIMVRLGDRRFLSRKTAFDAVLGLVLASMLARAINGSAPFFSTLAGGFVLVGLHRLVAFIAKKSHKFGVLVKGRSDLIIQDGQVLEQTMYKNDLTKNDVLEDLRLNGKVESPSDVKIAYFERDGHISVVPRKKDQ